MTHLYGSINVLIAAAAAAALLCASVHVLAHRDEKIIDEDAVDRHVDHDDGDPRAPVLPLPARRASASGGGGRRIDDICREGLERADLE